MTLAMFVLINLAFIIATIVAIGSGFLTVSFGIVTVILAFWMCKDVISGEREQREKAQWKKQVSLVSKRTDEELLNNTSDETRYEAAP